MRRSPALAYLLLLPALLFFAGYILYPIAHTFLLGFSSWSAVDQTRLAVGWRNYADLLADPNFTMALRNNGLFIVLSLAVQLPLALLLAVGVGSALRRHQLLRTLFFAPFVLPIVAVGLVWQLIYEPSLGPLNTLLTAAHLESLAHGWLGESETAIFAVIAVSCWRYVGFHMMIVLAGVQAIGDDLYEAARLDGATGWQAFWHVTLPNLRRVLLVDALLITVGSVKIFDLVKVMTNGGPGTSSDVLATFMYRTAFTEDRMGYSAAIAVIMLLITLAFTVVYLKLTALEEVSLPERVTRWLWRVLGALAVGVLFWRLPLPRALGVLLGVAGLVALALLVGHLWERLPRRLGRTLGDIGFALLAVLTLLPVVWAALGSFKSLNDLMLQPWALPRQWLWANYAAAWHGGIGRYLLNSVVVTILSVGLALACSAPAAYVFARLRVRGGMVLFGLIVGGILLPVHASLIPLFIQSNRLHLVNWPALIGPYVAFGLPLMVLMLRAYFAGLPQELIDAAEVDGCGHLRTLWHVLLPVARPAVATVCIFQASWVWNELPLALVLVKDKLWQILPVGLLNFQGEHATDWSVVLAGVMIAVVPILVLYFVFQKHIIKGLTAGAVK
ncbi:ABC transporter permease subunit [bacterium]|nr:ABC transporter permease subunit [bacterium]